MARITSIGFETNSTGSDIEASSITWNTNGVFAPQTSTVRTGTYAAKDVISGLGDFFFVNASAINSQFLRFYLQIGVSVNHDCEIALFSDSSGNTIAALYLTTSNTLKLMYNNALGVMTQIGSASAALSSGAFNLVELHVDDTGGISSTVVEGRLGGSVFATGTEIINSVDGGVPNGQVILGSDITDTISSSGTLYFDDVAVNDNSGSNQNSYPGAGAITRMTPNAAGDSNTFSVAVGGTAGAANNFTRVDEVTPNDATSYNGSATLNQSDLFKCADPAIGTDTVNCIQILARMVQSVSNATIKIELQWEKSAAGTIGANTPFNPNDTSFFLTRPGHDIVAYTNPDASTITESTLSTTQIGYKLTTASGTVQIRVSTIWMYIDHTPVAVATNHNLGLLGVGT